MDISKIVLLVSVCIRTIAKCDHPQENQPSLHLVLIVEIPVLQVLSIVIVLGRFYLVELDLVIY